MASHPNLLQDLADRARRGDRSALERLRQEMPGQMVVLVREALRGAGKPDFRRRVLATARQLARYAPGQPPDGERLAHRVALCLCESILERLARDLSASRRLRETVPA